MNSETRFTIERKTTLECATAAAVGCDRCPNGRLITARGVGGIATARLLAGVPFEAAVSVKVLVDGSETGLSSFEKAISNANTQPGLSPCPPDQCGYAEQVPALAQELRAAMTDMGLGNVRNVADPRPRQ